MRWLRIHIARFLILSLVFAAASSAKAQQERWQQLSEQAQALYQEGKYDEAATLAQEGLRLAEGSFGPDSPHVALALNGLALIYTQQAKYAQAEALYQRALSIYERAQGPEHVGVAVALSNLAGLYWREGDPARGASTLQRAAEVLEGAVGPEHPALAALLNNLAVMYDAQGKYGEAEPLYRRALAIREKTLGPEHPDVANSLNALALLYDHQGRYALAEALHRRALAIREKALGPEHPEVANSLTNLASVCHEQGRYAEGVALNQRALKILEKALGPDHPDVANVLNNLAQGYEAQKMYAEAEPLLRRVLTIEENALGGEHPDVARGLTNLAGLYLDEGKYAEAEPLYQRALRIVEKTLGPEHPDVAWVIYSLGLVEFAQGRAEAANSYFTRSLEILFHRFQYSFTYMSETERLQFLKSVSFQFPLYFSFCTSHAGTMPSLTGSMYDVLLWEKGFVGQSMAALRSRIAASGDPEALRLLDQLTSLKQRLAAVLSHPGPDREAWQKQITELQAQANQVEQQLVRRSGALQEEKALERATWRDVQKALKPGEAAVEVVKFWFYDGKKWTNSDRYAALVVTPETQEAPQLILLGDGQQLEGAPVRLYHDRVGASRGLQPADEPAAAAPATLYGSFWELLEPALRGTRRVYLSTDGVLNQVSVGLIAAPDGKLLLEKYDLRLVSSSKELLREPKPAAQRSAVLVGDPRFLLTPEQYGAVLGLLRKGASATSGASAAAVAGDESTRSRDLKTRGACSPPPPPGGVLCPLPGTAAELRSVASLLESRKWQVTAYTGQAALEDAVKAVHHPRLLHLATHGFFLPDQQANQPAKQAGEGGPTAMEDPMLRSGLLLAGADLAVQGQAPAGDLDDGVLTASEASTLDLQGTELVVLSACETGLGEVQAGEGVFGLRRALQIAGAQSVMMSLWSVPDTETQELMTLFYSKWLGGMEKHEALRQAQMEERAVVQKRYGKDLPYYWGAFVLVGR